MYLINETHSVHTFDENRFLFLCLVRIKNMFLFDEGRAEQQFHYRTVMINWLFTPNMAYQDLAVKSMELWNTYLDYESVPGFMSLTMEHKDPSESWGTWCVTRRRELCVVCAKTFLPFVTQEGSDQGRNGLPNEPGAG